ncbi:MAG: acyl-ACP desaturase [Candidatus Woykebacteria bacterium]
MLEWADKVSPESTEIIVGDFGVESFIEDYAEMAILASGDSYSTRQIYTQWVYDETRHSKALWYCLVDSGLRSPRAMDEYLHQCEQDVWTFEKQTGHEATPERGAAYAIAQERQTKRNYRRMRDRIWQEYGSPCGEDDRPVYPAIAGVCGTLSTDEGYHEGVFRNITRAYLRYWPDKALQAMWDVYERYRMPIVKLPNAEAFLAAVLSTGIDSHRDVITEILKPTYKALGLESRVAVKRAAGNSWDLPDGAVIQIGDKADSSWSEGVIPYVMKPDGSFVPVERAA